MTTQITPTPDFFSIVQHFIAAQPSSDRLLLKQCTVTHDAKHRCIEIHSKGGVSWALSNSVTGLVFVADLDIRLVWERAIPGVKGRCMMLKNLQRPLMELESEPKPKRQKTASDPQAANIRRARKAAKGDPIVDHFVGMQTDEVRLLLKEFTVTYDKKKRCIEVYNAFAHSRALNYSQLVFVADLDIRLVWEWEAVEDVPSKDGLKPIIVMRCPGAYHRRLVAEK